MTAAAMTTATEAVVASLDSGHVFAAGFVASVAYMALTVPRFISLEVVEWPRAAFGHGSGVAMVWVVAVVDVAVEAVRAMEPRTGSDEESACEPVWAVVTVGCAGVW